MKQSELIQALIYEPDTGLFFHRRADGMAGRRSAKHVDRQGRVMIRIHGKKLLAHRVAFLYHHGWLPKLIDHINGDPSDNRISNLRSASVSENAMNRARRSDSAGRFKGVHGDQRRGKFYARITAHGKRRVIGGFDTDVAAAYCYDMASLEIHGAFGRTNFLPFVVSN